MTVNPRRDAWSAIRGFYYQVQLTVQRWLELTSHDELFCERGEDIEVISGQVGGAQNAEQLLEQVKIRGSLSLRSAAAVSAVIRFFEATQLGAKPKLFRFITTATPAKERGVSFPRDLPGVLAWNAARNRELTGSQIKELSLRAMQLLGEAPRPEDIATTLAAAFQAHLSALTPEAFAEQFVDRIEWATGAEGLDSLRNDLRELLQTSKRVRTDAEASAGVDFLIAHVFRLLTQAGTKRLVASEIDSVLRQGVLSPEDRRVVTLLETFSAQTAEQLAALDSKTDEILSLVSTKLPSQLAEILTKLGGLAPHQISVVPQIADDPVTLESWIAERPAIVAEIVGRLTKEHAHILLGPTGMGKTTLAALAFREFSSGARHWISLGQRSEALARQHLLEQLLVQGDLKTEWRTSFRRVAAEYAVSLGEGLLVLDDVPDLSADPVLAGQIAELVSLVVTAGGRILITTHTSLASAIAKFLPTTVTEFTVPSLTIEEMRSVMSLAGIADGLLDPKLLEVIHATTSGHPMLVAATVRYIRSRPDFDRNALTSLLMGDSVKPVRLETRRRLRELLSPDARGLLDRLGFLSGRFSKETAFVLANVDPPVAHAGEIIEDLRGVWLHSAPNDEFELSPLLRGVGKDFLEPQLQQRVNSAVAGVYMAAKSLTPTRVIEIIFHLIQGREWRRLTGLLLQIAQQVDLPEHAKSFEILTSVYRPRFPADLDIPPGTRIVLRALQARISSLTDGETEFLLEELRGLTVSVDENVTEAFVGWLLVGPFNPGASIATCFEAVRRATALAPGVPGLSKVDLPVPVESLIWASIKNLSTAADLDAFLQGIGQMTDAELHRMFTDERLRVGVEIVAGKCLSMELSQPEEGRDWSRPIRRLDQLLARGNTAGLDVLTDAAEREKAVILADFMRQPEAALELLARVYDERPAAERMRRDHLAAAILLDQGKTEAALEKYERALQGPPGDDPVTYGDAARRAAEAAAKLGRWSTAIRWATRAVVPLRQASLVFEALDVMTELAWLHWRAGNRLRCAAEMARVVSALLAKPDVELPRYRESFRKAGMLLGWIATLEPGGGAWGGQPLAVPYPGWASRSRTMLADAPTPMSLPLTTYLLARVAAEAGFRRSAISKFRKAKELALDHQQTAVECMASSAEAEQSAAEGEIEGAVPAALFGMRMFALDKTSAERDFATSADVTSAWDSALAKRRDQIQGFLYWEVLAPLLVGGIARRLDDRAFMDLLNRLQATLALHADELESPERWNWLVQLAADAFGGKLTAYEIQERLKAHASDTEAVMILYLAHLRSPDASLPQVCGAQILCLTTFKRHRTWISPMLTDLPRIICDYWREVARSRAYALSGPATFQRVIENSHDQTIQTAARILLAALVATGTRVSAELRESLSQIADK